MTTTYIDPTASNGGNGSLAHPFNSWGSLLPGSTAYLQKAGTTFNGVAYLDLKGSAGAPITIGSYGAGAAPVIAGILDFDNGAQYITATGFGIISVNGPGIAIQNGANHIEVARMAISNSLAGIWMGNFAGSDNFIHDNTIQGSIGEGIGLDTTTAGAGHETRVIHNTISRSGLDGIEVTTDHAIISGNTVSDSGLSHSGTAGIHLWGGDPANGWGNDNFISGNVLLHNHDATFLDGEGILLDRNVTGNVVSHNLTFGNDSAGIADYDNGGNTITGNTLIGDGVGPVAAHPVRTELWFAEDNGQIEGNVIRDNVALSSAQGGFAVFTDAQSQVSGNSFSGNVYENTAGLVFDTNGTAGYGAQIDTWNTALGAQDLASGVLLNAPGTGGTDYTFAANTTRTIDGRSVHLVGWSAAKGLFGA